MKERPILFSSPMVRAILEGRKTQTRRLVKPAPHEIFNGLKPGDWWPRDGTVYNLAHPTMKRWVAGLCPIAAPDERLWVRETWSTVYDCPALPCCENGEGTHRRLVYRASEPTGIEAYCRSFDDERTATWRPSIHMPRWKRCGLRGN